MTLRRPVDLLASLLMFSSLSLPAAGCFFFDNGPEPPPPLRDMAQASDLASRDLSAPCARCTDMLADQSVGPVDLWMPDLTPPHDMAVPPDLALQDVPFCKGGYLNSTDPNACPLSCSPLVEPVPEEGAFHIPYCTPIQHNHNPPATGNHWPWPAPWGVHTKIVPREWWIHNLEHQGIVLLYNCPYPGNDGGQMMTPYESVSSCVPDGGGAAGYPQTASQVDNCPNEIAELVKLYNNHPADNWFDQFTEVRIVVTADPQLPGRFGAVAWDWSYVSNQLDVKALQCFIDARYGRGPEPAP